MSNASTNTAAAEVASHAAINQTEWLFTGLFCFAIGWAFAYVFKNLSRLIDRFGWLLFLIVGLPILMSLLLAGAMVADYRSLGFSALFLLGFVLGMLKRYV